MKSFNYKKATQIINFYSRHVSGVTKLDVLKLVYLTDKLHLLKYGRLITNDNYMAMEYGPVASSVKDIIDGTDFISNVEKKYASEYFSQEQKHKIKSLKDVDNGVFSETEKNVLQSVLDEFTDGGEINQDLVDVTHKYHEWKKHETILTSGEVTRMNMDVHDFFSVENEGQNDLFVKNTNPEAEDAYINRKRIENSLA